MNIQKLKDVFKKFSTDDNRAILVDGVWGIGKTYHVLQFLKESKKSKAKQKIVYVSLFGKSSIDEVHTEIYSRLHPIKYKSRKIIQVIPKVAPLLGAVGDIVSNLEFTLNGNENAESSKSDNISIIKDFVDKLNASSGDWHKAIDKKHQKNRNIIILDDFERLNFKKLSFIDVLGYVNSLFLQNFKVVFVCNSKEFPQNVQKGFLSFKEKVFDREYLITATNEEIIGSYFKDDYVLLKEHIIAEFDNNLRIAKRTSSFYMEALNTIKEIEPKYLETVTKDSILFSCTLIVVACSTLKYSRSDSEKTSSSDIVFASFDLDETLYKLVLDINNHVNDSGLGQINNQLISGLLLLYYYNDKVGLKSMFLKSQQKPKNPLWEEAFFLSDLDKRDLFNRQFTYIIEHDELNESNIFQCLKSMCEYQSYSQIDLHEEKIIINLLKKCDEIEIYRIADESHPCEKESPRFTRFRKAFREARNKSLVSNMCFDLKSMYEEKEYHAIGDRLSSISRGRIYSKAEDSTSEGSKRCLVDDIFNTIKECNFFLDDLLGSISYEQWDVALQMCDLSKEYNFSDKVIDFIKSIDFKGDQSTKERYDFLIQNKLCKILKSTSDLNHSCSV